MPYPVPPPPPPAIQIAAPAVATPVPIAPASSEPERQVETAAPATDAKLLGDAIERSTSTPAPSVSLTFAHQQTPPPSISATPAPAAPVDDPPADESFPIAPATEPPTVEEPVPTEPPIESPPPEPPIETSPPIETIQIDPTEENPAGQTLEIVPQPVTPAPAAPPTVDPQTDPSGTGNIVELDADYQEFDTNREIFTGIGNVEMRFRGAILNADRVQVNLLNRIAVAQGNVRLERGDQVVRGDRLTYNFVQTQGTVLAARGEVFIPNAGRDFSITGDALDQTLPTDVSAGVNPNPIDQAISGTTGITFGLGSSDIETGGTVNRIRFEADQLEFTADGWRATNVRLTNDPFSPPELELRSPDVTFTRLSPTRSEIRARNPRIVFDQGFSLPLFRERIILDSRRREPLPIGFGFDERDRGGFFIEGIFEPISTPIVQLQIRPQFFLQQAIFGGDDRVLATRESDFFDNFGLVAQLNARLSPTTGAEANLAFVSPLTFDNREDNLRASVRVRQLIGNHTLSLEYSFRDRLFNGSLGFQTVYSSLGFVFSSPSLTLGNTGINYSYQVGAQQVEANTDRLDLLPPAPRDNNRITLGRFQGAIAANRYITLWTGQPLPATPTEGLRYTPTPVTPFLALVPSARLIGSFYTSGDSQTVFTGSLGIFGQFGHYSRPFLDYTAFNLTYSQSLIEGESPFRFDRDVDERVLSAGIRQQIYGPFLFGVQASINLDRGDDFDTDYTLEYNRRTYSIVLRVNPERELGSISLRINDFNFGRDRPPFSGEANTVTGGVQRSNN